MSGQDYRGPAAWAGFDFDEMIAQHVEMIAQNDNDIGIVENQQRNGMDPLNLDSYNISQFFGDNIDHFAAGHDFEAARDQAISSSSSGEQEVVPNTASHNEVDVHDGVEFNTHSEYEPNLHDDNEFSPPASGSNTLPRSQAGSLNISHDTHIVENSPNDQGADNNEIGAEGESIVEENLNAILAFDGEARYQPEPNMPGNGSLDEYFEQASQFSGNLYSNYPEEGINNDPVHPYIAMNQNRVHKQERMTSTPLGMSSRRTPLEHNFMDSYEFPESGSQLSATRTAGRSSAHTANRYPVAPNIFTGENDPIGDQNPAGDHNSDNANDQAAIINTGNYNNIPFVPLYATENDFINRLAVRNLQRVHSDYPYGDNVAIHGILRRIFESIRNTTDVLDKQPVWVRFSNNSIPDDLIHETSWKIMLACRDSQELGGLLDREFYKPKFVARVSFIERVNSVVEALRKSKAICLSVMAAPYLHRLVDNADAELKQKSANIVLNDRKNRQNKIGQKAIANKFVDADGVWKVKVKPDAEAEDTSEAPPPQRKYTKRSRSGDSDGLGNGDGDNSTGPGSSKRSRR